MSPTGYSFIFNGALQALAKYSLITFALHILNTLLSMRVNLSIHDGFCFIGLDTLGDLFEEIREVLCSDSEDLRIYHVSDVDCDDNWLTLATPDEKAQTLKSLGFKEDQVIELDADGFNTYGNLERRVKFEMDQSKSLKIDRKSHGHGVGEIIQNGRRVKLETTGRVR